MFHNENFTFLSDPGSYSNGSRFMTSAAGQVFIGKFASEPVSFVQTADTSFCGRFTDGSIATSQGTAGHLVTGDIFRRLATAPLLFHFNFEMYIRVRVGIADGPGVCSLTVKWSC